MKKAIFVILMACVNGNAVAAWVKVLGGVYFDSYVDPATIRRAGNIVTMWTLRNYKTTEVLGSKKYLSTRLQYEIDCKQEHFRTLYATFHSGPMADGDVIDSASAPDKWAPIPPESVIEVQRKFACSTRK